MAEKGDSTHPDGSWVPEVVGFGLIGLWARKVEVELAGFWTVVGFPLVNAFSTVFAFWAGAVFRAALGFAPFPELMPSWGRRLPGAGIFLANELAILSGVEDLSRFSAVEEPLVGEILCVAGGFFATVVMIKGEEIASVFEFQLRVKTCPPFIGLI